MGSISQLFLLHYLHKTDFRSLGKKGLHVGTGRVISSCSSLGLLLIACLLTVTGPCVCAEEDADSSAWAAELDAARCRVRCVDRMTQGQSIKAVFGIKNINGLAKCLEDLDCSACMKSCGKPYTTCSDVCLPEESACEESCDFLRLIHTQRPGVCPKFNPETLFPTACVAICQTDTDCEGRQKCCEKGCGKTCVTPHNPSAGAPEIPRHLAFRERSNGASIELSWQASASYNSSLVLYLLQSRWNIGKHPIEGDMTPWRHATMSTRTSAVVRDIKPGTWYQFRVAAVNIDGSNGFTEPTKPFRIRREPNAPSAPENFTEGNTKIQDGKISVIVQWQPPKKTELPISRYKVFWSKRLKTVTAQLMSLTEHKKALPGDQLQFELEDLDADTTYFVQVQAISFYGEIRLKSERASMYITTYAMTQATQQEGETPEVVIQALPNLAALINVSVDEPFYQNGLLRANITWSMPKDYTDEECEYKVLIQWTPEVCIAGSAADGGVSKTLSSTTHDSSFEIYDLSFNCRYVIKVQPFCKTRAGPISHSTLETPSCGNVVVRGTQRPDCPTDEPSAPGEPRNVQHSFLIRHLNITAKISWDPPAYDMPLRGYRLMWGPTLAGRLDTQQPVIDYEMALTKVVPVRVNTFSIGNLEEGTSYIVRLQALSDAGSGSMSVIHFRTPQLQPSPIEPPYGIDTRPESPKKKDKDKDRDKDKEPKPQTTTLVSIPPTKKHEKLEASLKDLPIPSRAASLQNLHINLVIAAASVLLLTCSKYLVSLISEL